MRHIVLEFSVITKEEKLMLLDQFVATTAILRERFGGHTSIDELYSAYIGHRELIAGRELTVAKLARLSDVPESSLRKMIDRRPNVHTNPHPEDDRKKVVSADEGTFDYLEEIMRVVRKMWARDGFPDPDSMKEIVKDL